MLLPLIVAYLDICKRETGDVDNIFKLFGSSITFLFGSFACKLFSGTKGAGKCLYILGIMSLIGSFGTLLSFLE